MALLVELEPAHDQKWFFGQGNWMKITQYNMDKMIEAMRLCYKERPTTNWDGVETAQKFTWKNTVNKLLEVVCS